MKNLQVLYAPKHIQEGFEFAVVPDLVGLNHSKLMLQYKKYKVNEHEFGWSNHRMTVNQVCQGV